jgi:hypothetical protein
MAKDFVKFVVSALATEIIASASGAQDRGFKYPPWNK